MAVRGIVAAGSVAVLLALAGGAFAAGPMTERVSVTPSGQEPNAMSYEPSISADGRLVAYTSNARDIVPGVIHVPQVYVYDRTTGKTVVASSNDADSPGNRFSGEPAISANGRFVAFSSVATNLVPGTHVTEDIYVKDLRTGDVKRASVDASGDEGNNYSASSSISADGGVVTFSSDATNLTPVKPKARRNEFVHYMKSGKTLQVNVGPTGVAGNGDCHKPSISGNGRLIAFASRGTNLLKGGSKGWQIFVRDLKTRKNTVASLSSSGKAGDALSSHPVASGDGRYVAFESLSKNLVNGDTNGKFDVFLRDLSKRTTKRISVSSSGQQSDGPSMDAAISNHGGFVAYYSEGQNLTPGQARAPHIFVYSSRGGSRTQEVDVTDAGVSADSSPSGPSISGDGRLVAFASFASNLVAGPPGTQEDIYIRGPLH